MIPKPQRDWLLVALEDEAPPANGGLVAVVRLARPASTYARVVAVGPEVRDVRVGAKVVISRLQGIEIGDGQLLLPESAVLALEPNDDATGAT